jgi:type I restriction enzyme R subunit
VSTAFREGQVRTTGTAIVEILPRASRFSAAGGHGEKKQRVIERLGSFFGLGDADQQ